MIVIPLVLALSAGAPQADADTVVSLGSVHVDLTGDGQAEVLELVGAGETIDSLEVTFSITSDGRVLYSERLRPVTRTLGFDAGKRLLSRAEHLQRLEEMEEFFFGEGRFSSAAAFVTSLERRAPRHIALIPGVIARDAGGDADVRRGEAIWEDMQRRAATVYTYSGGGDGRTAIAWSELDQRFYRLWQCC